jgi:AcrR family transcriptional regulator
VSISVRDTDPETQRRRKRARRGFGEQLRDEILDAATELMLEGGNSKAASIRSVARRVGVTPPSIYLHFADKEALLDAVCARYFESLDKEMQRAGEGQSSTIEVLRAQGLAYVRFALRTPALYRIATMGEGRPGSDIDLTLTSGAFGHLRASAERLIDEGVYAPADPTSVALELWTVAHGVAALLIAKPYLPWGEVEEFADRVMRVACYGQIVNGLLGVKTTQDAIDWLLSRGGQRVDGTG